MNLSSNSFQENRVGHVFNRQYKVSSLLSSKLVLLFVMLMGLCCISANAADTRSNAITSNTAGATVSFSTTNTYEWTWDATLGCMKSGRVTDDSSITEMTITTSQNTRLSFDWEVSSEPKYDELIIILDNSEILRESGLKSGNYSSLLQSGEHKITFMYSKDDEGRANKDIAYVKNVKLEAVVSPTSVSMFVPSSMFVGSSPYQLTPSYKPYSAVPSSVTYTSSNTSVATVTSTGLITAKAKGSTTITCNADGKTASSTINVIDMDGRTTIVTSNTAGATISFLDSYAWEWDSSNARIRSGNWHKDSSTATATISISTPQPTNISFDYQVSSESSSDYYTIKIDDVVVVSEISYQKTSTYTGNLSTGTHRIELIYFKDGSDYSYDDRAYFKNLKLSINTSATSDSWDGVAVASNPYSSGSGSLADPYIIRSCAQFKKLMDNTRSGTNYSGKYFKLACNLNFGTNTLSQGGKFAGIFDGDGHSIEAMKLGSWFFQEISSAGIIKNTAFTTSYSGNKETEAILCQNNYGLITNCTYNTTSAGSYWRGAYAVNNYGTIANCFATGIMWSTNTSSQSYLAGIAYDNRNGCILNCSSMIKMDNSTTYCPLFSSSYAGYEEGNVKGSISNSTHNTWVTNHAGCGYSTWLSSSPYLAIFSSGYSVSAPTSITLSNVNLTNIGDIAILSATITPSSASNCSLTWTSSNTSVATVDAAGVVRAKAFGTTTITASAANGQKATCTVTVGVLVTSISMSSTSESIPMGSTTTLSVTYTPTNAANRSVTWSSSNTAVATVSSSGVVTAKTPGTATITARTSNDKTATCTVTVTDPRKNVVTSNTAGATVSFSTSNSYEWEWDSTNKRMRSTNYNIHNTFSTTTITINTTKTTDLSFDYSVSSEDDYDELTIILDGTTIVSAISGTINSSYSEKLTSGTHTINLKYVKDRSDNENDDRAYISNMKLDYTPVTSVSLNKSSVALAVNGTSQLSATVAPSNATIKTTSWSSSNTSVATVSTNGLVTAKAAGTATITVTTTDGSKKATCSVHVHNLTSVAAKAATCTAAGNKAYWYCSSCSKYFSNATATTETTLAAVTLAKKGHGQTNGYTPTYTWGGTATAPTCKFTLQCKDCNANVVSSISLNTSTTGTYGYYAPQSSTASTCTTAGSKTYRATGKYSVSGNKAYSGTNDHTYSVAALGHSYKYTDRGDGTHKKECTRNDLTATYESHTYENGHCKYCSCTSYILDDASTSFANASDVQFSQLTYTRSFGTTNYQCLYVPMTVNVQDIATNFDVYKIGALYLFDADGDGDYFGENDPSASLRIFKVENGVLKPNHPYYIKAKSTGKKTIPSYDNILYASTENSISCSTMETTSTFYGNLTKKAIGEDFFTVSGGKLEKIKGSVSLGAFRWYMLLTDRDGQTMPIPSNVKITLMTDEDEEDDIDHVDVYKMDAQSIYSVNGMKQNTLTKGVNIIRYSDGTVKKVLVK